MGVYFFAPILRAYYFRREGFFVPKIQMLAEQAGKRIYVHLPDEETCTHFLRDAEAEGFTFCDGALPTSRPHADLYALNPDKTLNFVGYLGHLAYACAEKIGERELVIVDYKNYVDVM